MKPFIKWPGGKRRLAPTIARYFPPTFKNYYEPFVGAGGVFFYLRDPASPFGHINFEATISDANPRLTASYVGVQSYLGEVIAKLREYEGKHREHGRVMFDLVRRMPPPTTEPARAAAWLIYILKTCFNGLYRENSKGEFNSPFGDQVNPLICDAQTLADCSHALRLTKVLNEDFFDGVQGASKGDLVYMDPPYHNTFTNYRGQGFDEADQVRVRNCAAHLANNGVKVVISNSDTPFIREIYSDFRLVELSVRRSIAASGGARGEAQELLILT